MVAASCAVMLASAIGVWAAVQALGPNSSVEPLYAVVARSAADPAASSSLITTGSPWTQGVSPTRVEDHLGRVPAIEPIVIPAPAAEPAAAGAHFNGHPARHVRTVRMLVTAYCSCEKCCGHHSDGLTASGYSVFANRGKLVAADTRVLPFGSLVQVPGYDGGRLVPVLDRGRKIKGHRLDLLMPTHKQAKQWGARWVDVKVYDFE